MKEKEIRVQMLGDCVIAMGERQIEDRETRSKKIWLLLAYLIYHRRRVVSQTELMDLLWAEERGSTNPSNALKTILHRVRAALDQLEPGAGHDLILRRDGGYGWNNQIPTQLDAEQFEVRCRSAGSALDEETRLQRYMEALSLYRGEFLSGLSSVTWVIPLATYYHNLYIQVMLEVLPLLEMRSRFREMTDLCQAALRVDPYNETLYRYQMQGLLAQGDQRGAAAVYEEMSKLLLSQFGVMPSEEIRAVYRQAIRTSQERVVPAGMLREQLRESGPISGALLCDYDFFKVLYQAEARSVARSGDAVHIVLITLKDAADGELSRRSLECAMENLAETLKGNLRKGDVISRCSASQYVVMLSQANYENSCMVADRLVRAFARRYPHSPARLDCSVQPLEPT